MLIPKKERKVILCKIVTIVLLYKFSGTQPRGGGGKSHIKRTEVLVGNFEKIMPCGRRMIFFFGAKSYLLN